MIGDLDVRVRLGSLDNTVRALATPRMGEITLPQVVAEGGRVLERVWTVEHAAAKIVAAPLTLASTEHSSVSFRYTCYKKARPARLTSTSCHINCMLKHSPRQ